LIIVASFFAALAVNSTSQSLPPLPTPPNTKVPKPSGPVGNLKVLNWAGFHAALTYTFDDSIPSQIANDPKLQATGARMTFSLVGLGGRLLISEVRSTFPAPTTSVP
jgi:hypothetical protein